MKAMSRSLVMIFIALIAVPVLAVTQTVTTAVQLLAATVLVMGGTGHSLGPDDDPTYVTPYLNHVVNNYVDPGGTNTTPTSPNYNVYAVTYPAQFFPVSGSTTFDNSVSDGVSNLGSCLGSHGVTCGTNPTYSSAGSPAPSATAGDPPYIVVGYSQSAVVASLVKNQLINDPTPDPALNGTTFYLISNPMRPNGGILGRGFQGTTIPILGITFYGPTENSCGGATCSPSDTTIYPTVDVAQQYDLLGGDAPARPLNLLAMGNSLAAYAQLHGNVPNQTIANNPVVVNQGKYGDTQYYLITDPRLPILMPLETIGVPSAALALPDAILRVWIEDGYVRNQSPGAPVGFQLSPIGNPIGLIGNTLGAIPVGIDDTVAQASGDPNNRPLGTANVYRPFGVGGPVYDPVTGAPAQDNVGVGTGGSVLPFTAPAQQQPTGGTQLKTNQLSADNLGNSEAQQQQPEIHFRKPPSRIRRVRSKRYATRSSSDPRTSRRRLTPAATAR